MVSLYRKIWELGSWNKAEAMALADACDIDPFLALLLQSRGYGDPVDAEEFLSGEIPLEDPGMLADMEPAVARIRAALEAGERITIFGDYDCDGVTATSLLWRYLSGQGADVHWYVPNRSDGYGLRKDAMDTFAAEGTRLILTVDTGITANEPIAYANSLGMDVVVTDHHLPGETLPPAVAVVDPHRVDCPSSYKSLAGVGVAFKLVCALADCLPEELLEEYGALVTIGTIADVMPLTGENRAMVTAGLACLTETDNLGLRALLELSGALQYPIAVSTVSFNLAPRINAAGRMGDASRAVRLFLTEDPGEAETIAAEICNENAQRQRAEEKILAEAEQIIAEQELAFDRILVVAGKNWHHGVVGIAASKIMERYGRPVLLLSIDETGVATGSGRSFGDYHLFHILESAKVYLDRFGGHELAVGLSLPVNKLEDFRQAVNQFAASQYPDPPLMSLHLDCKLNPAGLTPDLVRAYAPLAPFGAGNPVPVFGLFHLEIGDIRGLKNDKHLKLTLRKGNSTFEALLFGTGPQAFPFSVGDQVDIAATLDIHLWQGQESLTVQIRDFRPAGLDATYFDSVRDYEALRRGEHRFHDVQSLLVNREDAVKVFRCVRTAGSPIPTTRLLYRLLPEMPYCKVQICLDVLLELQVLLSDDGKISVNPACNKVDLEASLFLQQVRQCVKERVT